MKVVVVVVVIWLLWSVVGCYGRCGCGCCGVSWVVVVGCSRLCGLLWGCDRGQLVRAVRCGVCGCFKVIKAMMILHRRAALTGSRGCCGFREFTVMLLLLCVAVALLCSSF